MSQGYSSTATTTTTSVQVDREWGKYDYFLDSQGLLAWDGEGGQNSTQTLDLQPPQQDVRNNPNEIPSALGRFFSQADWSHGAGQGYFHKSNSDPASFLHSEGFDVSTPGVLKHLRATAPNGATLTGGRTAQAGNALFVTDGTNIRRYATPTATHTVENPHGAETATTVNDIAAEGERVFAALGANGLHVRDAAGTWTHFNDVAAILVRFLRGRIIACTATTIHEVTTGGTAPPAKLTLPAGWTFTDIGENGQYIYATAVNEASGLSHIHHFGLDNSLVLQHTGTTPLPDNDLAYSFKGYLGMVFIGCGRKNKDGGKNALLYKAEPQDGFLNYSLVADSKGAGTLDLSVRSIATYGRKVLLGWALGTASPYGAREGLAVYDSALDSFTHHLSSVLGVAPVPTRGIQVFNGTVCFTTNYLYREVTDRFVAEASLISSAATWGNAGLKDWDQTEVRHKKLPSTSAVEIQYTTRSPEDADWAAAGASTVPDSAGATFHHPNVKSQRFSLRVISRSTQDATKAPEIETYSTRSNPTLLTPEWRLVRTVRIFDRDRSSARMEEVRQDPHEVRSFIRDRYLDWVQWYEPDDQAGFTVRLVKFQELDMHTYTDADSNQYADGFFVVLVLEGTRNA